ncbi:MAG TPA: O-antigen ligase family protein, partial [Planctomycetota bacterium]|nr:O-antigen ligase family protein [Planctomycetota bacterium]
MTTNPGDRGPARILDGLALGVFAGHASLRLALRGGEGAWGSDLSAHLLVPLGAGAWLAARALERRLTWRLTGLEIPLAVLVIPALLSMYWASFRLGALDGAAGLASAALAVPLAVHLFGPGRRHLYLALLRALIFVVALYGVVQYVQLRHLPEKAEARMAVAEAPDAGEFEGRMKAGEPWSTLHYPNTFAGFLVLTLPFILGTVWESRNRFAAGVSALTLGLGLFGLGASGSLGSWVAASAAAAAFALLEVLRRKPGWKRPVLATLAGVFMILVILVAAGPLSPKALARRSESMAKRDVYWDAAARVAKAHPLGIGMNNFEDYYPQYKDDRQEEVRNAHNDYLQILAELGIAGLLGFLALLVVAGGLALKAPCEEPAEATTGPSLPACIGIGAGFLVAFGLQGIFNGGGVALAMTAAGIGGFLIAARAGAGGTFTRIGLAAGLAGAAVHFLVDFDFYDPAFRHFFMLSLAALALTTRLEAPGVTGVAVPAVGAILCFVLVLPLGFAVAPRFLEAEGLPARAAQAEKDGKPEEADAAWEAAALENPLDPEPVFQRGLRHFEAWRRIAAAPASPETAGDESRRSDLAVALLDEALRRRPRAAGIACWLATAHEFMARRAGASEKGRDGFHGTTAALHATAAEKNARLAVELYPTRARNQYLLGRILDAFGRPEEAAACFREALRLSALARSVPR